MRWPLVINDLHASRIRGRCHDLRKQDQQQRSKCSGRIGGFPGSNCESPSALKYRREWRIGSLSRPGMTSQALSVRPTGASLLGPRRDNGKVRAIELPRRAHGHPDRSVHFGGQQIAAKANLVSCLRPGNDMGKIRCRGWKSLPCVILVHGARSRALSMAHQRPALDVRTRGARSRSGSAPARPWRFTAQMLPSTQWP